MQQKKIYHSEMIGINAFLFLFGGYGMPGMTVSFIPRPCIQLGIYYTSLPVFA